MRHLQCSGVVFKSMKDRNRILVWTEGSDCQIFRAEILDGEGLDVKEALKNAIGEHIPENHLFPPWKYTLTEVQQALAHSHDVYVKKHYLKLLSYAGKLSPVFMEEVEVLELLSRKPHPNINKYLGCIRNGDLIGGICLEKLECTLYDLVRGKYVPESAPPFQPNIIISGIKAGIEHIHSFGLVHGDINPSNIMIDKAGNAVIIDFDSCVAVGAPCGTGTPGWTKIPWESSDTVADFDNDAHGLDLVAKFVRGEYDGQDIDIGLDEECLGEPQDQLQ